MLCIPLPARFLLLYRQLGLMYIGLIVNFFTNIFMPGMCGIQNKCLPWQIIKYYLVSSCGKMGVHKCKVEMS